MTTTAPAIDPVEYVKALPVETRERVFAELRREFSPVAVPMLRFSPEYNKFLDTLEPEVARKLCEPLPDDFDFDAVLSEEEITAILRGVEEINS